MQLPKVHVEIHSSSALPFFLTPYLYHAALTCEARISACNILHIGSASLSTFLRPLVARIEKKKGRKKKEKTSPSPPTPGPPLVPSRLFSSIPPLARPRNSLFVLATPVTLHYWSNGRVCHTRPSGQMTDATTISLDIYRLSGSRVWRGRLCGGMSEHLADAIAVVLTNSNIGDASVRVCTLP